MMEKGVLEKLGSTGLEGQERPAVGRGAWTRPFVMAD
jgi:hypothetical protein